MKALIFAALITSLTTSVVYAADTNTRIETDTQRNVNQQQRIAQGVQSGALTNHEASRLERGQAHVERREARAEANGHVSAAEQHGIQRVESRQSRHIYGKKHNARTN